MVQITQPGPGKEAKSFAVEIRNEMARIWLNIYHIFPECFQLMMPPQSVDFKLDIISGNCVGILVGNSFPSGASVRNRDHCLREIVSAIPFDDPDICSERNVGSFCSDHSTKFLTRVITFLDC